MFEKVNFLILKQSTSSKQSKDYENKVFELAEQKL
jgi:hypothetical protein